MGYPGARRTAWVERLPLAAGRPWLALVITLFATGGALWLRILLFSVMPGGAAFVTFFPTVLLVTFLLGTRMGIVAAVGGLILAWYFLAWDPARPGFFMGGAPAVVPYMLLVTLNIGLFHWLQRSNAKLGEERARSAALAETREILFRELQHRVSNNLQVAASLLALQKKHVSDEAARNAVDEAARRLGVIGRISRELYHPDGATRSMHDFLKPLCADVVEMSGRTGVTIEVEADDNVQLAPDAAVPLALIVAETISNAIEHGLADRETGRIDVVMTRGDSTTVEIRDDGCGLPDGFDLSASKSLGLGIVRALADQLGGRFELLPGRGATARLTLPA